LFGYFSESDALSRRNHGIEIALTATVIKTDRQAWQPAQPNSS
jgi:hypothetical protein